MYQELDAFVDNLCFGIERDLYFEESPASQVICQQLFTMLILLKSAGDDNIMTKEVNFIVILLIKIMISRIY